MPFAESWLILAVTMFASGMVFTMCSAQAGRWALLPPWGLMVMTGNPSPGGAVPWPLLPSPLGATGRWVPPGAPVNGQHTAVHFRDHQHARRAVATCAVCWARRPRRPGGR